VVAGDGKTPGGLVAPMFGPDGCIGILALETRQGREQEPAVQAVAAIVAAQLATAVAAWPAASVPPAAVKEPAARTA
jgi:GAF domain-containing protein